MYGIAQIREDLYFWSRTIKQSMESERIRKSKFEKDNLVNAFQSQLFSIEKKIESDINEYYEREQKLGWVLHEFRKKRIIRKISELEECLGEVKRKQEELKNYQS